MTRDDHAEVERVWREESARLIGGLTRMTRDLALAEDLAQDALLAAIRQWPAEGAPANAGAWLMAVAKRRAVDHFRRQATAQRGAEVLAHEVDAAGVPDLTDAVDHIEDDVLRLVFLTCHPVLAPQSRAALTLRLVGGLTTAEIARAFLVREPTMGQRISRAKRSLADIRSDLAVPAAGAERDERLRDVMAVIYLIFNEGYVATAGEQWMRPDLCLEAVRLARLLADLIPAEPEVHGLQALLELQASRMRARHGPDGEALLLDEQDRRRWDELLIRRGLAALDRARAARSGGAVGPYVLQAEIAACHARARESQDTDWVRISELYDLVGRAYPSAVVEINRALAHGRAHGADAGLAIVDAVAEDPSLADSALVPSVRGDLLERRGDGAAAAECFQDAAARTRNDAERQVLLRRAAAAACRNRPGSHDVLA